MLKEELRDFLEEDFGTEWRDVSSSIVGDKRVSGEVITRESGVVAGLNESSQLFDQLNVTTHSNFEDGDSIDAGDVVLEVEGSASSVLRGERSSLNILCSMSGIATVTRKCVNAVNDEVVVAATRKTTPGYRSFEKKAVRVGGGDTHRYNLGDAVMIKENHISVLGLEEAVERAREESSFTAKIEVEAETLEEAKRAEELGVDIVLLDNMTPGEVENCVKELDDVIVEASGGITPENVAEYAETGVDVVSMGSLIHSSDWLDMSMKVVE